MREYIDSISDGTGAILVRDISLKGNPSADFMKYLRNEGFKMWSRSKGSFDGVDWVYVNLNSKRYAYGMPGIPVTTPFGNHAVTIDEFRVIYEIYRKYEDRVVLSFE